MSLETPEAIRNLQRKLYVKAKQEPAFRFYLLYDKLYRPDILLHAYLLCKANGGVAGVDGVTFADIEKAGREQWLAELGKELHQKTYRPGPVRRVMIPKPGGGERPLGIPTIRDRVAQTAAKLILEPIFEAEFVDQAYGYRPRRSAGDAVQEVHQALRRGYTQVVDADLSKYFDTIPHKELMQCVARRVVDRSMLRLVRRWLKVPVEERDEKGNRRYTGGKGSKAGTPQGGVISPLLANLYMHRYLKYWHQEGKGRQWKARIVNYADDFVILCQARKKGSVASAQKALEWTGRVMAALKLTLNTTKTCIRDATQESFRFLGYSFGPTVNPRDGKRYLGAWPADKSVQRIKQKLHEALEPWNVQPWEKVAEQVNRILRGWSNYFSYGTLSRAYSAVDNHVYDRVRHFLRRRHKLKSRATRLCGGGNLREWGIVQLREVMLMRRQARHVHALK